MHLRRDIFATLACLCTTAFLCAQETPAVIVHDGGEPQQRDSARQAPPPPPLPRGRIAGHVLCSDTHRPARGATLLLIPIPSSDVRQNTGGGNSMSHVALDGSYAIEHLQPGEYSVMALLPGYLSPVDDVDPTEATNPSPAKLRTMMARNGTVLVHGAETETLDVTLERGASVSGRVLYSDGSPAALVTISVENAAQATRPATKAPDPMINDPSMMIRGFLLRQNPATDDQGRYRISGLKAGSYRIVALPPASGESDLNSEMMESMLGLSSNATSLRLYAGNTLHRKSATLYDLHNGEETPGVDMTLPLDLFHQVRGLLSATDGRPINNATLTLVDTADDTFLLRAKAGRDGTFVIPSVPPGTYKLTATEAGIFNIDREIPGGFPLSQMGFKQTAAFADGSVNLIVKDSDLPDALLTLHEVPLPPTPPRPAGAVLPNDDPL